MSTLVNTWACEMCGITLENALKEHFPVLYDPNIISDKRYFQAKARQYRWERTQKKPKKTCSKSCGFNYTSWQRTSDPKASYIKEKFDCDYCGNGSVGGRLIIKGKKTRFYVCRRCHRKRLTVELRRQWEIFNREYRNQYARNRREKYGTRPTQQSPAHSG